MQHLAVDRWISETWKIKSRFRTVCCDEALLACLHARDQQGLAQEFVFSFSDLGVNPI